MHLYVLSWDSILPRCAYNDDHDEDDDFFWPGWTPLGHAGSNLWARLLQGPGSGALELQQQQVQQQQAHQQVQQQVQQQLQLQQTRSADSEATNGNAASLQQQAGTGAQESGSHVAAAAAGSYMQNSSSEDLLDQGLGQGAAPSQDPAEPHGAGLAPATAQVGTKS